MGGWITIPERDSFIPFSFKTSLASSHKTQVSICDSTVSTLLPAAVWRSYDNTPISRQRAHDIIQRDVRIQEEYLNADAQHLAENIIQTAIEEVQQEDEQTLAELSKQGTVEKFLKGMKNAKIPTVSLTRWKNTFRATAFRSDSTTYMPCRQN